MPFEIDKCQFIKAETIRHSVPLSIVRFDTQERTKLKTLVSKLRQTSTSRSSASVQRIKQGDCYVS